jgi:hypothetical protein
LREEVPAPLSGLTTLGLAEAGGGCWILGTTVAVLEADTARCSVRPMLSSWRMSRVLGTTPGHTLAFDDQVAWLATRASKRTATESWVSRVAQSARARHDRYVRKGAFL